MRLAAGPGERPRRRLRTRLLLAMVAVAFGVLVLAVVGAGAIARSTASDAAVKSLKREAPTVASEIDQLGRQFRRTPRNTAANRVCEGIAGVLRVSGTSVVVVTANGTLEEGVAPLLGSSCANRANVQLPRDLHPSDLNVDLLLVGQQQSGVVGGTAFVADPLPPVGTITPVVVLTQGVQTQPLGRAGGYFLLTGAVALIAAGLVSAYLARRLTKPIAAMRDTAQRIAGGDLSARVGVHEGPDDELQSLARSLDAMATELETARGHERAFLLSVSHDLRTPLTSIRGYAEAIKDGMVEDPVERARAGSIIAAEARRLERLVADLLDLARLDAHQFSLNPRPVDARGVVDDAVAGFVPSARDWGLRLEVVRGTPAPADLDPERLAQITANLVENALKYARSAVRVDLDRRDGRVELHVDDDGPGIPTADRDRVFERLYTARETPGRKVGTGIGLAIVHELAGAMGGAARCEPLDGGGTRFTVTIPA
ncbi:MAG TPA: HAMP domain-containing sensor histidine kinase [Acidimicrobiia bacterium]|nr:HAMP domain-containing sensor histidine kinase [Acidimicrobiia bacterium]